MWYLKLWRRFVILGLARTVEYRLNFLFSLVTGLAELALAVLTFVIMFRYTSRVSGWSLAEVLMLAGLYKVGEGLIGFQIAPNMLAISGYIRTGEMDFILLSPVSSRFLVSTRTVALPALADVLAGLILIVYAGDRANVQWTIVGVAEAAIVLLCGLILLYSVWFFTVTFAFWLVQVESLDTMFYSLFETARYPISFFKGLVRAVLIFGFPVAFATTFPAQALLGTLQGAWLPVGAVMALLALWGTQRFWAYAVRHYSSASS
jgi:ABC-2 type transport system permease protein